MLHVFVETNWLVDYAAPVHRRLPSAVELMDRARRGELTLHLPNICVVEAKRRIRQLQPRQTADDPRNYVRAAYSENGLSRDQRDLLLATVGQLESRVRSELENLDDTFATLVAENGLDLFPLDEAMLKHSVEVGFLLDLDPFDLAVLAALLGRADRLRQAGETQLAFCEKDKHLQPWDKNRNRKPKLSELYEARGILVYGDFDMTFPLPPGDRPAK